MELYFLGTGAGMPTTERNVTAIALRMFEERGTFWLFDAGEATQHQMLHSPLKPSKLEKVFITHLHGDHLFGLPGLLSSRSHQGGVEAMEVYGPRGIRQYLDVVFATSQSYLNYDLKIIEIEEGIVFSDEQCTVEAALLDHRIECYGYRIEEAARPGKIDVQRLISYGIQPGPLYGQLKQGKDVYLENGQTIRAQDVIGEPIPGRVVTILGDTSPCEGSRRLSQNADMIVHEATFGQERSDSARAYGHSTAQEAALTAKEANAGQLILTHFSARYSDLQPLLQEAQQLFPSTALAEQYAAYPISK